MHHCYRFGLSTPLVFKTLKLDNMSPIDPDTLLERFITEGPLAAAERGNVAAIILKL